MIFVLGIEIVRVSVFVSGLVIFFANATTLELDASIRLSFANLFCSVLESSLSLRVLAFLLLSKSRNLVFGFCFM